MRDKSGFSDLVRSATHDIDNQLAIMSWYFDLALMEKAGHSVVAQKGLLMAKHAAVDLDSLISDLSRIIVMAEKNLVLDRERTDLRALILDILKKKAGSRAKTAGVKLSGPDKNQGPLYCVIDPRLISKVLGNLMSNAILGTHRGGRVEVSVGEDKRNVTVTVKDNGELIPAGYRKKIFEKSSLKEMLKTIFKKRVGLSLIFCKLAAEAHGGSIRAEAGGKANVFILTLPKEQRAGNRTQ